VEEVPAPAVVEGAGHFLVVFVVLVFLISFMLALSFHFGI
jgi:hypothetical protein